MLEFFRLLELLGQKLLADLAKDVGDDSSIGPVGRHLVMNLGLERPPLSIECVP